MMPMLRLVSTAAVMLALSRIDLRAQQADAAAQVFTIGVWRAAGVMALVPAALLYALHRYWRRPYVKAWVAMWLSMAFALFAFSLDPDALGVELSATPLVWAWARLLAATAGLVWLGGVALLALTATWVRGTVSWPRHAGEISAAVATLVLAGTMVAGRNVLTSTLWIGGGAALLWGAFRYFKLARRDSSFGALLIGGALAVQPVHAALTGLLELVEGLSIDALEVSVIVYAMLALGMHVVLFEDVTYQLRRQNKALADAQAALKARAMTDPLTGCYNRRFFDEISAHALERHKRHRLPLALLFADCDRFKAINDASGHETGDRVLVAIAELLRSHVRQSDYVFRWGGDEFLVMLTCDAAAAAEKAAQIRRDFAMHPVIAALPGGATLSIGWLDVPRDTADFAACIRDVDRRMYAEKRRYVPSATS
jgi:diguanylate cyclase (GGDEF)-like protein